MILITQHDQKRKLLNVAPQTVLTMIGDIMPPQGSFIVNMSLDKALWRACLFVRANELGHWYDVSWPWTWPLRYIMQQEKDLKGAELW